MVMQVDVPTAGPTRSPVIEACGLHKHSLHGLDLALDEGERVAVVGGSGSGKYVLLGCVLDVHRPDAGTVEAMTVGVCGESMRLLGLSPVRLFLVPYAVEVGTPVG